MNKEGPARMEGTRGTMRSRPSIAPGGDGSGVPVPRRTWARGRTGTTLLADGLVEVPLVPLADPASAILTNPIVAEGRRFCCQCDSLVGRSTPAGPGQPSGVCAQCGTSYNFTPMLRPGDVIAGQYEVQGCLTHGGLGWIYLAIDRNVSDRWVVLKGLLHSQDPAAQEVVVTEREFLAELSHPSIVKIFNFVEHPRPDGGMVGYIVMEYIGGFSLKELAAGGTLSIEHAIAYILEILPALEYMHSLGLAYNDLKPDNIMIEGDHLKIIDLGAVASIGSYGYIYGTRGFQAPEIMETGPTPASDIYTVGRTLAVLTVDVAKEHDRYLDELPAPESEPLFTKHEFYHRLLLRCTEPDPELRYPSARALAADLTGVLREILATALASSEPHRDHLRAGGPLLLLPAPSARAGTRARGEHRVAALTKASVHDLPASVCRVSGALRLRRRVSDQAGLAAPARAANLSGAVAVDPRAARAMAGRPCVVVDDVVTTGATLAECARALRQAGCGPVIAVTLAATRRRGRGALPQPHVAD